MSLNIRSSPIRSDVQKAIQLETLADLVLGLPVRRMLSLGNPTPDAPREAGAKAMRDRGCDYTMQTSK